MPVTDLSTLDLSDIAAMVKGERLPPVESWHPAREAAIDIVIKADGSWWHEGGEITRPAMVRLFSTILRRETDGSHVLVTPAEKLAITVEDTAFIAVEVKVDGEGSARTLAFRLNTGDVVVAGAGHPLTFADRNGAPHPLLHVRGAIGNGLEALLARPVFYELAELALADDADAPAIWSQGVHFALTPA